MTYKKLDMPIGKIGVAPAHEIEEVLAEYKEHIVYKARTAKFREVEVTYKEEKFAEEMASKKLKSEKWVLFPTYRRMEVVRLRMGRILPEFEVEWVFAATLNKLEKGQVLQVIRTNLDRLVGI